MGNSRFSIDNVVEGEQKLKNTGRVFPLTGLSGLLLIHFIMPEVRDV